MSWLGKLKQASTGLSTNTKKTSKSASTTTVKLDKGQQVELLKMFESGLGHLTVSQIVDNVRDSVPDSYKPIFKRMSDLLLEGDYIFKALEGIYPIVIVEMLKVNERTSTEQLLDALKFCIHEIESDAANPLAFLSKPAIPFIYFIASWLLYLNTSVMIETIEIFKSLPEKMPFEYGAFVVSGWLSIATVIAIVILIAMISYYLLMVIPKLKIKERRSRKDIFLKYYDLYYEIKFWRCYYLLAKYGVKSFDRIEISERVFSSNPYISVCLARMKFLIANGSRSYEALAANFLSSDSIKLFSSIERASGEVGYSGAVLALTNVSLYFNSKMRLISRILTGYFWFLVVSLILSSVVILLSSSNLVEL